MSRPPPPPRAPETEAELAAFERLKPRLAALWSDVFPPDEKPYTSVVVPSLTLDAGELTKLRGVTWYEERLLFLMIRLRNPRARLIYVTSQPIHPSVVDYYLQLLAGIPASHARRRLTLLSAHDASLTPLSQKILSRPRLLRRIRDAIYDPALAYLTVFNSTPLERRLAIALDIPLNGVDPELAWLGSKSGSRRLFREAGVELPEGFEGLRSERELAEALHELRRRRGDLRHAVLKLDESFAGEGNALFCYPAGDGPAACREALHHVRPGAAVPPDEFLEKFERMGGVVEEHLDAAEVRSPSVQLRINPRGRVFVTSTHEQLLEGPTGQCYAGCRFPASPEYRAELQETGRRIAERLAEKGVVSRLSVDFLTRRDSPQQPWRSAALEINLRMGGTTHPMLALRFLTGGTFDEESGLFHSANGATKYYRATDDLASDDYSGLLPEDLVDIFTLNRLHYDPTTETGVLFHMIGAVSEHGKFGLVAIGNSPQEADEIFERTRAILDRESLPPEKR